MRMICKILVCLMILCIAVPGTAETLTFQTFSADSEAEYLNLDIYQILNWNEFYDFLGSFPNLKQVDMFDVLVYYGKVHEIHERFPDIEFGMTMCFGDDRHILRTARTCTRWIWGTTRLMTCRSCMICPSCAC